MTPVASKYIHNDEVHNLTSPGIIVPFIISLLHPKSVVDIGCGTGTFLKVFKEYGITKVAGVDGAWVNHEQLHISRDEFIEADLEKPIRLPSDFNLVLCLEVAEHLSADAADTLIETLVSLGKIIVFSAALPLQGGQNHVNEQPMSYWQKKFEKQAYKFYDVFRSEFWNNENVDWWYKQNMMLVMHESVHPAASVAKKIVNDDVLSQIHPDLLRLHIGQKDKAVAKAKLLESKIEKIKSGQEVWQLYGSMLLHKCKSLFSK